MIGVAAWEPITNAFCKTGKGGGIKNDCSPKDKGDRSGIDVMLSGIGKPDGGFTYSPTTKDSPKTGFALSVYPERSFAKDVKDLKPADLADFVLKNADLLSKPEHYIGGWHDPASGKVFLDVSIVTQNRAKAVRLAKAKDQIAYFDLKEGKSVVVNPKATSGGVANIRGDADAWESIRRFANDQFRQAVTRSSQRETECGRLGETVRAADGPGADRGGKGGVTGPNEPRWETVVNDLTVLNESYVDPVIRSVVFNAFCPTGKGGGIKNDCPPDGQGAGDPKEIDGYKIRQVSTAKVKSLMTARYKKDRDPMDDGMCGAVARSLQLANPKFKAYAVTVEKAIVAEGEKVAPRGISHLLVSDDGGETFVDGQGLRSKKSVIRGYDKSESPRLVEAEYRIDKSSREGGYYKAADSHEEFYAGPYHKVMKVVGALPKSFPVDEDDDDGDAAYNSAGWQPAVVNESYVDPVIRTVVSNVFCPTGEGGGIKPDCPAGGTGGGGAATKAPPKLRSAPSRTDFPGPEPREPLCQGCAPDHVKAQGEKIAKTVSPAEKKALEVYTAEDPIEDKATGRRLMNVHYSRMNKALRNCPETLDCLDAEQRQVFDAVNNLASKNKLDKPVLVYRGVSVKGADKEALVANARAAAEKGGTITLNGIGSTSLDPEVGASFSNNGVVFEVKAKTGAYVDPISKVGGEEEFIIPHGKKYRVKAVLDAREFTNVGGRTIATATVIQMEEVD